MPPAATGDARAERNRDFVRALFRTFVRTLRSPTLAVILFLALAILSAVGTVTSPPGGDDGASRGPVARVVGLERTFSSPFFLALVVAAALNIAVCTWHRLVPRLRARRARLRSLTDLALHGSFLLILAGGAVKGAFGFVGTQNILVGEGTDTVYDWRVMGDAPLGFRLRIEEFQERYYPVRARIGLQADGGEKLPLLEVLEGEEARSPDGGLSMRVAGYDPAAGTLRLVVVGAGGAEEVLFRVREPVVAPARAGAYSVTLVAYRADLREVRARIALEESGARVQEGWLATNDRLRRRGTSLFLTAWGLDDAGRRFCGIQAVRDPGAPVFWMGCILLALTVPAHLLVKGRGAGSAAPGVAPELRSGT